MRPAAPEARVLPLLSALLLAAHAVAPQPPHGSRSRAVPTPLEVQLEVAWGTEKVLVAVVTELTLSDVAGDGDRSLKSLKSDDVEREVQLWTCGRDPTVNTPVGPVGQIEWSLFSHIQNITSVSVCGVSLGADGRLNASAAALKQAQLFAGTMGLAVYPLIGGNLSSLHAAMGRGDAFFADSIALATTLVADGFNLE